MYSMKFSLHSDDIVILCMSIMEAVCHSVPLSGKAGAAELLHSCAEMSFDVVESESGPL